MTVTKEDMEIVAERVTKIQEQCPLKKGTLAYKLATVIEGGQELTIREAASQMDVTQAKIQAALKRCWKGGHLLAPISVIDGMSKEERKNYYKKNDLRGRPPGVIRNAMESEAYFIVVMNRYANNYLMPMMKKIFTGINAAIATPGLLSTNFIGDLIDDVSDEWAVHRREYKKIKCELYDN